MYIYAAEKMKSYLVVPRDMDDKSEGKSISRNKKD